jgi:large subunit ribosomal protein L3
VTVLNLKVVKIDVDNRTLLVRGAVPGVNRGTVVVRAAVKK